MANKFDKPRRKGLHISHRKKARVLFAELRPMRSDIRGNNRQTAADRLCHNQGPALGNRGLNQTMHMSHASHGLRVG